MTNIDYIKIFLNIYQDMNQATFKRAAKENPDLLKEVILSNDLDEYKQASGIYEYSHVLNKDFYFMLVKFLNSDNLQVVEAAIDGLHHYYKNNMYKKTTIKYIKELQKHKDFVIRNIVNIKLQEIEL